MLRGSWTFWAVRGLLVATVAAGCAVDAAISTPAEDANPQADPDSDEGVPPDDGDARADGRRPDAGDRDRETGTDASDASPDSSDDAPASDAPASDAAVAIEIVTMTTRRQPTHLVVDGAHVYSSNVVLDTIERVAKTGGTQTNFRDAQDSVLFMTGDATNIYAVVHPLNKYTIDEYPKAGGASRRLYTSGPASNIDCENVVVDGPTLYVGAGRNAGGTVKLLAIDRASMASSQLYDGAAHPLGRWLGAGSSHLFWMSGSKLYRAPKAGVAAPTMLAWPGSSVSGHIAADGADVFYVNKNAVDIHRVTGATDVPLHGAPVAADVSLDLVVDATHAYVIGQLGGTGTVYRVPRAGGTLEIVAAGQPNARALALDATHVYWTVASPSGPAIMRRTK